MSEHDDKIIRCRRLGHDVPFKYCRTLEGRTVCRKIRDCWWERFDVDSYLRENLSAEEYERVLREEAVPPPKLYRIIQLAREAKAAAEKDG